jgi:AraC-like DNA-binding protein
LLAATDLDAVAISMLVGFAEPNSFARAVRHWERTTPTLWRDQRIGERRIHKGVAS